ncbi:MAG: hypothetical protein NVSMB2_20310 [Chloroflexota bacterium]
MPWANRRDDGRLQCACRLLGYTQNLGERATHHVRLRDRCQLDQPDHVGDGPAAPGDLLARNADREPCLVCAGDPDQRSERIRFQKSHHLGYCSRATHQHRQLARRVVRYSGGLGHAHQHIVTATAPSQ